MVPGGVFWGERCKWCLQGPLSVWVEKECCQELLQHLLLGFELYCYLPNEFCMLYW